MIRRIICFAAVAALPIRLLADITPNADLDFAVERGLGFIARQSRVAATQPVARFEAQTLLAFLAAGHVPERGALGLAMRNASLAFAAKAESAEVHKDRDVSVVCLLEASGLRSDSGERRAMVQQAVEWLEPQNPDATTESLAWYAIALRRSNSNEIDPDVARTLRGTLNARQDSFTGAFSAGAGEAPSIRSTAAALLALHQLGGADDAAFDRGLKWLLATVPAAMPPRAIDESFWVCVLAIRLRGEQQDLLWRYARPAILSLQQEDGSFLSDGDRLADSCKAVMALSMAYRVLPAFSP